MYIPLRRPGGLLGRLHTCTRVSPCQSRRHHLRQQCMDEILQFLTVRGSSESEDAKIWHWLDRSISSCRQHCLASLCVAKSCSLCLAGRGHHFQPSQLCSLPLRRQAEGPTAPLFSFPLDTNQGRLCSHPRQLDVGKTGAGEYAGQSHPSSATGQPVAQNSGLLGLHQVLVIADTIVSGEASTWTHTTGCYKILMKQKAARSRASRQSLHEGHRPGSNLGSAHKQETGRLWTEMS